MNDRQAMDEATCCDNGHMFSLHSLHGCHGLSSVKWSDTVCIVSPTIGYRDRQHFKQDNTIISRRFTKCKHHNPCPGQKGPRHILFLSNKQKDDRDERTFGK